MADGLESALWEPLSEDAWVQASLAVDAGGLGMRASEDVALPAFLSSRVAARPLVAEMAAHTQEAGLCEADACMRAYDARTKSALDRWLAQLPETAHEEVRHTLDDGADVATQRWHSWLSGVEPPVTGEEVPKASPLHLQRTATTTTTGFGPLTQTRLGGSRPTSTCLLCSSVWAVAVPPILLSVATAVLASFHARGVTPCYALRVKAHGARSVKSCAAWQFRSTLLPKQSLKDLSLHIHDLALRMS